METLYTGLTNSSYICSSQIGTGLKVDFVTAVLALILSCLVILGSLNSLFRYRSNGHGNPVTRGFHQIS